MGAPVVRVQNVSKTYYRDETPVPVLEGIDLEVAEGEFVALMGPSGSGKSTLLNLIAGIDRASSGRVEVAGSELSALSEHALAAFRSRHIGFIFQLYNLIPVLTAYENVELPLLLTPLSKADRGKHVMMALDVVGLSDRKDHTPRQLSGGQEQRVSIARAIVADAPLIVADEPTGNLDHAAAEGVLALLERLNRERHKTIVMVTHDPRAAAHGSRRKHLDKGELHDRDGAAEAAR
jgi:putative ABC transport system ATP-binding protein